MATLHFGIHAFPIDDDEAKRLRAQISNILLSGQPEWLTISGGSDEVGLHQDIDMFVMQGVPIVITTETAPTRWGFGADVGAATRLGMRRLGPICAVSAADSRAGAVASRQTARVRFLVRSNAAGFPFS
jgi:hypothetical protein